MKVSLEEKEQFKVRIQWGISDKFRRVVSRKWGIDKYGLLSYEVEHLLKFYISVGGILPDTSHTHKNSQENQNQNAKAIHMFHNNEGGNMAQMEMEMTTAIVTNTNGDGRDYHKRPIEEDPILRPWLLSQGIDLTNIDSVASRLTEEDIRVGELEDAELKQWKKNIHDRLVMKLRRTNNNNRLTKLSKRDRALESELAQIKQHLNDTDSIREQNKVYVEQIYKAYVVVTGKRDYQRVFKNRLHEYIDAGYVTPIDDKYKIFRAEEKFLAL